MADDYRRTDLWMDIFRMIDDHYFAGLGLLGTEEEKFLTDKLTKAIIEREFLSGS